MQVITEESEVTLAKQAKRNANGIGNIRKRADGRWEARYCVGFDPKTGALIRKSVYCKTQKEARQKLTQAMAEIDDGSYLDPCSVKFGDWLDLWLETYVSPTVKPYTTDSYTNICNRYLKPYLGRYKLSQLSALPIQKMYNELQQEHKLSAKTVKNIHGVLHRALTQAVKLQMLKANPSDLCDLPKVTRKEIQPMEQDDITAFLRVIRWHKYERLYAVTLFTGMRQGEVLGLTWDCVDFQRCTLTVSKQLQKTKKVGGEYTLVSTKSGKSRIITVAPSVMEFLREEKRWQEQMQILAGSAWDNSWNLVFTNELGRHLVHFTVYKHFKEIVREIGMPKERFHDLRHSYAVVSIENGDDMKTVQTNLGHATSSFTLDVYGHVSQRMHQQSAERMERFIQSVTG